MPRNNMDNKANLRKVQEALNLQNIKSITFDVIFYQNLRFSEFLKCHISTTGNLFANCTNISKNITKT